MRLRASSSVDSRFRFNLSIFFVLLMALLASTWLAGGASRASVLGQVVVRAVAWGVIVFAVLLGKRPSFAATRPVFGLLLAIVALPLAQLIPLPPSLWQELPGRGIVAQAATLTGQPQHWHSLSLSPDATLNAAYSLVVPVAVLFLLAGVRETERAWLPAIFLMLVVASTIVGLVQISGLRFSQPLINYTYDVSGTFANRNHFAIFLALGCLVSPVWALAGHGQHQRRHWRLPFAIGLLPLFVLTILASGSRAGLLASVFGLLVGPFIVREDLRRAMRGRPRWFLPAGVAAFVGLILAFVGISIGMGRAVSIDRLLTEDVGADMRARSLTTVMAMTRNYFPFGTGLGSFDPVFRLNEPFGLLNPSYFNQAHDDFLGVVLDAGLAGAILILVALAWWLRASLRVWRASATTEVFWARLGAAMLFVILAASAVDYPTRTPLMMAAVVMAATWLARGDDAVRRRTSLPAALRRV